MKRAVLSFIAGSLIFGVIGVYAGGYIANLVDFKVLVNGTEFISDPPPLEVDGRTYLPLRSIGDALGIRVEWNEDLRQVEVGDESYYTNNNFPYYKQFSDVPDFGAIFSLTRYEQKKAFVGEDEYFCYTYNLKSVSNEMIEAYENIVLKNGFRYVSGNENLKAYVNKWGREILMLKSAPKNYFLVAVSVELLDKLKE